MGGGGEPTAPVPRGPPHGPRGWELGRLGSVGTPVMIAQSSLISFRLDGGPVGRPCKAMLSFADPDFLPLSYYFDPLPCPGRYLASFLVPAGAPNGDAFVTWQCAGLQPLCSHARISGGSGDPSIDLENAGTAACVSEFLQTTTTLVTSTLSSSVLVESHRAIATATSTSLHAAGSAHAVGSGAQTKPGGFSNRSQEVGVVQATSSSSTPASLTRSVTSSSTSLATFTGRAVDAPATSGPRRPADDAGGAPPVSNTLLTTLDANAGRTEVNVGAPRPTPATMPTTPLSDAGALRLACGSRHVGHHLDGGPNRQGMH
ncbi:hypothetical protein PG991_001747 [Apiospora marii]|uniref:Uncharacterized protein n=1 Tax=Apiospora marii TaxID=335849 RepID=A0ABR1SQJ8_9PEZI